MTEKRTLTIWLAILLAIILVFVIKSTITNYSVDKENHKEVCFPDTCITAEIANTPEERARGLMFRESLDWNNGMLFIFDASEKHSFWMKNTLIPLDIIWVDESLKVVDIKSVYPCNTEVCETYAPNKSALYVIEVNLGFVQKNNINAGDKVEIK